MTRASDVERLYRETGDRLWWALLAYTGHREIANDAASEAFARALNAPETINDPGAWVWRVAFRVAAAELREHRRSSGEEQEASYEMDESTAAVLAALDQLSHRQRPVFVLFYLEDLPTKQIAELLGMSQATVSVHLHRARNKLRSILGDDDD